MLNGRNSIRKTSNSGSGRDRTVDFSLMKFSHGTGRMLNISRLPIWKKWLREYIRQRNPKGIFVAIPHFDKQHYHIHICASGIEFKTGKSLRFTKTELQSLKKNIQQFQMERFPELSKSVVQHGKKDKSILTDREYQIKLRTGRETEKEQLIGMLKTCYKKANSKETFFQLLKECRLIPYERGGRTSGIVFKNKKFRLKNLGFTAERLEELNKSFKEKMN